MAKKSEYLTMQSMTASLFLKFYDEHIIESFGTEAEKATITTYSYWIKASNDKIKEYQKQLKSNKAPLGLDKSLEREIQRRDDLITKQTEYTSSVVTNKGYIAQFYSHLRSIPCVTNEGSYSWDECYYVVLIKHDKDYLPDDIWNPTGEKAHYHLAVRTMPCPGKRVRQIRVKNWLELLHIKFRPGIDDSLMKNQGLDICKSYNDCVVYMLHATQKSIEDGKYPYAKEELVHNMNKDYLGQLLLGAHRIDSAMEKLTVSDWMRLEEDAGNWGLAGMRWRDFLTDESFTTRAQFKECRGKAQLVMDAYFNGMQTYLSQHRSEFVRHSIYIEGLAKQGKTKSSRLALNALGYYDDDIFDVGKGTAKFDMYQDERALICEDRGLDDIRRVTESEYCRLRKRNRGESLWYGDVVIVTSNEDFTDFCIKYTLGRTATTSDYNRLTKSEKDSVDATKSRFTHLKCDNDGYVQIVSLTSREDGEKKVKQAEFVFKFVLEYNKARKKYLDSLVLVASDDIIQKLDFLDKEYPAMLQYRELVDNQIAMKSYFDTFDTINEESIPDEYKYDGHMSIGFVKSTSADDVPFGKEGK